MDIKGLLRAKTNPMLSGLVVGTITLAFGIAVESQVLTSLALTVSGLVFTVFLKANVSRFGYWRASLHCFFCLLFGAGAVAGFLTENPDTVAFSFRLALAALANQFFFTLLVVFTVLIPGKAGGQPERTGHTDGGPWQ